MGRIADGLIQIAGFVRPAGMEGEPGSGSVECRLQGQDLVDELSDGKRGTVGSRVQGIRGDGKDGAVELGRKIGEQGTVVPLAPLGSGEKDMTALGSR